MKKHTVANLFFLLGTISFVCACIHKLLITSDIPVAYTVSEAIVLHLLLFLFTLSFICGAILISQKRIRHMLMAILTLLLILGLSTFKMQSNAEYFTSSYAQLSLAFVIHPLLILLINIFLLKYPATKE